MILWLFFAGFVFAALGVRDDHAGRVGEAARTVPEVVLRHHLVADAEVFVCLITAGAGIVPGAVHMVPAAAKFDEVPSVAAPVRRILVRSGTTAHIDAFKACCRAEHQVSTGIAVAHAGAIEQNAGCVTVRVGIVIVGVIDQPVVQHQRAAVVAHVIGDERRHNAVCLADGGGHIGFVCFRVTLVDAGLEAQFLPVAVSNIELPEIAARLGEDIRKRSGILRQGELIKPLPAILEGIQVERLICKEGGDGIGRRTAGNEHIPCVCFVQQDVGHISQRVGQVDQIAVVIPGQEPVYDAAGVVDHVFPGTDFFGRVRRHVIIRCVGQPLSSRRAKQDQTCQKHCPKSLHLHVRTLLPVL